MALASCGPKDGGAGGSSAAGGGAAPGKTVTASAFDLSKCELAPGAEKPGERTIANLTYKVKASVNEVYQFHKKQILAKGWKEMPDASGTDQSISATYAGAGQHISLTVYSTGTSGSVDVMLHHHGSVNLDKLPLPPGTMTTYAGPITVMHVTAAPVAETSAACRKLLLESGWEPHGSAGDSLYFKQGTNRITLTVSAGPAQGGKTLISYLSELMSADLPAPPDADGLQYSDSLRRLTYQTMSEPKAIFDYYKQALGKSGWKPNRDESYHIDDKDEMVFRNGDGVTFVEVRMGLNGVRNVVCSYTTVTEMNEAAERMKAKLAEKKKMESSGGAGNGQPAAAKIGINPPEGATGVEQTANSLKFNVGNGKAKAVVEGWRQELTAAGWKEDVGTLDAMAGMLSLSKESQRLSISYSDTGLLPAEVNVNSTGVELQRKE